MELEVDDCVVIEMTHTPQPVFNYQIIAYLYTTPLNEGFFFILPEPQDKSYVGLS